MPNVANMVVNGSLPISERSALRCMNRPNTKTHSAAGGQAEPEVAGHGEEHPPHVGAQHEQLAVRKIHHVHNAEYQGQARGHQGQDEPGGDADEHLHHQVLEQLAHSYTPRYL